MLTRRLPQEPGSSQAYPSLHTAPVSGVRFLLCVRVRHPAATAQPPTGTLQPPPPCSHPTGTLQPLRSHRHPAGTLQPPPSCSHPTATAQAAHRHLLGAEGASAPEAAAWKPPAGELAGHPLPRKHKEAGPGTLPSSWLAAKISKANVNHDQERRRHGLTAKTTLKDSYLSGNSNFLKLYLQLHTADCPLYLGKGSIP